MESQLPNYKWLIEWIVNISQEALPILGFNYGYITYESQKAQITIGPMECRKKYIIPNFTGTYIV